MTTEQELKAIFNLPKETIATPTTMAVEYESIIYRLKKKEEYITALYSKYLDEIKDENEGHTVTKYTKITELGFSDKAIATLKKLGITTLSDFKNVTRAELEQNKAIGDDNTRRIAKIIEPIGIAFSNIPDITVNADTFSLNEEVLNKAILSEEKKENAEKKELDNEKEETIAEENKEEYVLNGNIGPIEDAIIIEEDKIEPYTENDDETVSFNDYSSFFDIDNIPGTVETEKEEKTEEKNTENEQQEAETKEKTPKRKNTVKKEKAKDVKTNEENVNKEEYVGAEEEIDVMDDIEDEDLAF